MTQPNETELIAQVAQELSVSADTPLLSPTGQSLTLREAVAAVLQKITTPLSLNQRPVSPQLADDLYGHILSLRAEQLQTQALTLSLCQHLGLDPTHVIQQAQQAYGQ